MQQVDYYGLYYQLREGSHTKWSAAFASLPTVDDVLGVMKDRQTHLKATFKALSLGSDDNVRERETLGHLIEFTPLIGIPEIPADKDAAKKELRIAGVAIGALSIVRHKVYLNEKK